MNCLRAHSIALLLLLSGCTVSSTYRVRDITYDAGAAESAYAQIIVEQTSRLHLDRPVRLVHGPMPQYPPALYSSAVQGRVDVRFTVGSDGRVTQAAAVTSVNEILAATATAAVEQWRFEPVTRDGEPIPLTFQVPFMFERK